MFAKCWSSQSIHKIQSASGNSHPSFQRWWSARPCASERPVPPGFVTMRCQLVVPCVQSLPLLLAASRNVRNPTCFREERARQVKCKGNSVCSKRRAEWWRSVHTPDWGCLARGGGSSRCACGWGLRLIGERDGNFSNRST